MDATQFLDFTNRLHSAAKRVEQADVTDGRRGAWQGRLIAISESAQVDMPDAEAMLERLVADLDRHVPR